MYYYLQECENCTSLPGQSAVSSAESFSDIPPYVLSRLSLIAEQSYCNGSKTESCPSSQSGMMCEHSMASHGGEKSMLCVGDSPAKTSAAPEKEPALTANEADYGEKWPESLAKYDPVSCLWKTRQCCFLEGLDVFSGTWPSWGMMQGGELYPLKTPALHIRESDCGLWPTPMATATENVSPDNSITENGRVVMASGESFAINLASAVKLWPTPTARDWKDGSAISCKNVPVKALLGRAVHGGQATQQSLTAKLNPDWVEWLMGWPIGWTDLKPLETDKFRQWLRSHGESYQPIDATPTNTLA